MGDDGVEITCEVCGDTDTYPPNQSDRRFCSIPCKAEWQSEHVRGEDHPNWKGDAGKFTCENCGTVKRRKPSEIGERNFCDPTCKGEWMSEHLTGENHHNNTQKLVECAWCGDDVARPKWQREQYEKHFCDDDCRKDYFSEHGAEIGRSPDKIGFNCDYCDEYRERIPAEVIPYDHNFCDRDCRADWFSENVSGEDHPNWKGGVGDYYGDNWHRIRRKVRKRDRYECQFCGVTDGAAKLIHGAELHVHHATRKDEFETIEDSNSLSNLLTLCAFCHQRIF